MKIYSIFWQQLFIHPWCIFLLAPSKLPSTMRSIPHWVSCLLVLFTFNACSDPDYQGDAYIAFGSVDELADELLQSIKNRDANRMLRLLDNQQVVLDLLEKAEGDDARTFKDRLTTAQGKRVLSSNKIAKKQRISAMMAAGLPPEWEHQLNQLRSSGVVFAMEHPFAEDSPAQLQNYVLHLSTETSGGYTLDFTVIYWNGYYHLVDLSSFLNKL